MNVNILLQSKNVLKLQKCSTVSEKLIYKKKNHWLLRLLKNRDCTIVEFYSKVSE